MRTKKLPAYLLNDRTGATMLLRCHLTLSIRIPSAMYQHTCSAVTCSHVSPTPCVQLALKGPFVSLPIAAIPPPAALCACSERLLFPLVSLLLILYTRKGLLSTAFSRIPFSVYRESVGPSDCIYPLLGHIVYNIMPLLCDK